MSDFGDSETTSLLLADDLLYLLGGNISKQPEKERNASQDLEQDMTIFVNRESELSKQPEEESLESNCGRIESSRRSAKARAP